MGREAEGIVAQGGLLPDEVMLKIVTSKLDLIHNKVRPVSLHSSFRLFIVAMKHWILDGFPRTLGQGQLLDAHLKCVAFTPELHSAWLIDSISLAYRAQNTPLTLVVNLDVPNQVILSRISDRWVHLPSGRIYNMSYNRPKVEGFDDQTGEPLTKRPDDNPVRPMSFTPLL